jgi:hypothetical protein
MLPTKRVIGTVPKNGGKWRFFEGQKRHFSLFGARTSQYKPLAWLLLCRPTFLALESEKNGGRHFSGEDFCRCEDSLSPKGREEPIHGSASSMAQYSYATETDYIPCFH